MKQIAYRVFQVKHLGQTETKPARIKIQDNRMDASLTVPRNRDKGADIYDQARYELAKRGIEITAYGLLNDNDTILLSENFSTPLREGENLK